MSQRSHDATVRRCLAALLLCVDVRGRAETRDGDEGSADDPRGLQPARAIRRALADGGLKAADIDAVWACYDRAAFPNAGARARAAIELAFGRHADRVVVHLRPALRDARISADVAVARCARAVARGDIGSGVAVAIGIRGSNSALAFGRRR